jgi:predicted PurR-regulated permease PerM
MADASLPLDADSKAATQSSSPRKEEGSWFDAHTARVIITLMVFAAAGAFVYAAWRVIVVFIFAIFLAYILAPAVAWVEQYKSISRGSRALSILWVYVTVGILIAILILFAGPPLVQEGRKLSTDLPNLLDKLTSGQIAWQVGQKYGLRATTQVHLQRFLADHSDEILAWGRDLGRYAMHFVADAVWIVLVPILAIFFLKDGDMIARTMVESVDRRNERRFLRGLLYDIDEALAHYIRAQLILAGLSILAYTAVLSLIGLPYAVVLGVISGMLEFIPVVGPLAAAAADLGVGLLTSFHHVILLVVFLALWRLLQDYYTSPRIMGGKLKLHPLAVLFGVFAGGEVGGVIGVYLSIPIIATLRIFWRRYHAYAEMQEATANAPHLPPTDIHIASQ